MGFSDRVVKIQDTFYDIDLTDSIIDNLTFEQLTDFKITIDYYYTEEEEEQIVLLFKNCTVVDYSLDNDMYKINNYELNYSQFTITKVIIEEVDKQICAKIFTVSNENVFLKIICQDIII
ncbi:hypothetical protein [Listeria marthii]|uniref:hypothetical protein n=1 Tax=Listeria marthii TaxID=529731 RepID=UPI00162407B0|nr:hypothetical protein [Listeria marthii]